MRKLLATLAVAGLVAAPAVVNAQAPKPVTGRSSSGGTMWGPFAAVNMTTAGGSDATGVSSRVGIAAGAQLQRTLAPSVFLRVAALYSMRGADFTGGYSAKISYIEVPVMFGYEIPMQGSRVTPYVMAGGQLGIKVSCTVSGGGTSTDCDAAAQAAGVGKPSSTDYGFNFGAGVGFPSGSGRLMIDGRYYFGLSKALSSQDIKNRGFTIGVGYMIPLGH
jgi:hypothetical protein